MIAVGGRVGGPSEFCGPIDVTSYLSLLVLAAKGIYTESLSPNRARAIAPNSTPRT